VLVQRALRLLSFLDQSSMELDSHVSSSFVKLKIIPDASYMDKMNITDILSLPQSMPLLDHYNRIQDMKAELVKLASNIKSAFLSIIDTNEDCLKLHENISQVSGSLDEVLMRARELQDHWDELMIDATVHVDDAVFSIQMEEVAAKVSLTMEKKPKQPSIIRYAVILVLVIGMVAAAILAHRRISTRAKKMN
jgi:hypothetical protein